MPNVLGSSAILTPVPKTPLVEEPTQEFKKNNSGQVVTSTLNEYTLNEIANITRGIYLRVANQVNTITPLLNEIDQMDKRKIKWPTNTGGVRS